MGSLVREPDALIGHVRFDERDVETEHGLILRHWQSKEPAPAIANLNHRATSRLYESPEPLLILYSGLSNFDVSPFAMERGSSLGADSWYHVSLEKCIECSEKTPILTLSRISGLRHRNGMA